MSPLSTGGKRLGCLFKITSRFNRLAWGYVDPTRPRGVIAAGMENGELALWDPAKILAGARYVLNRNCANFHLIAPCSSRSQSESLILRNTTHTGPVRGLDFNPIQTNLLSSGGINGEVGFFNNQNFVIASHSIILGIHLGSEGSEQTIFTDAWCTQHETR